MTLSLRLLTPFFDNVVKLRSRSQVYSRSGPAGPRTKDRDLDLGNTLNLVFHPPTMTFRTTFRMIFDDLMTRGVGDCSGSPYDFRDAQTLVLGLLGDSGLLICDSILVGRREILVGLLDPFSLHLCLCLRVS